MATSGASGGYHGQHTPGSPYSGGGSSSSGSSSGSSKVIGGYYLDGKLVPSSTPGAVYIGKPSGAPAPSGVIPSHAPAPKIITEGPNKGKYGSVVIGHMYPGETPAEIAQGGKYIPKYGIVGAPLTYAYMKDIIRRAKTEGVSEGEAYYALRYPTAYTEGGIITPYGRSLDVLYNQPGAVKLKPEPSKVYWQSVMQKTPEFVLLGTTPESKRYSWDVNKQRDVSLPAELPRLGSLYYTRQGQAPIEQTTTKTLSSAQTMGPTLSGVEALYKEAKEGTEAFINRIAKPLSEAKQDIIPSANYILNPQYPQQGTLEEKGKYIFESEIAGAYIPLRAAAGVVQTGLTAFEETVYPPAKLVESKIMTPASNWLTRNLGTAAKEYGEHLGPLRVGKVGVGPTYAEIGKAVLPPTAQILDETNIIGPLVFHGGERTVKEQTMQNGRLVEVEKTMPLEQYVGKLRDEKANTQDYVKDLATLRNQGQTTFTLTDGTVANVDVELAKANDRLRQLDIEIPQEEQNYANLPKAEAQFIEARDRAAAMTGALIGLGVAEEQLIRKPIQLASGEWVGTTPLYKGAVKLVEKAGRIGGKFIGAEVFGRFTGDPLARGYEQLFNIQPSERWLLAEVPATMLQIGSRAVGYEALSRLEGRTIPFEPAGGKLIKGELEFRGIKFETPSLRNIVKGEAFDISQPAGEITSARPVFNEVPMKGGEIKAVVREGGRVEITIPNEPPINIEPTPPIPTPPEVIIKPPTVGVVPEFPSVKPEPIGYATGVPRYSNVNPLSDVYIGGTVIGPSEAVFSSTYGLNRVDYALRANLGEEVVKIPIKGYSQTGLIEQAGKPTITQGQFYVDVGGIKSESAVFQGEISDMIKRVGEQKVGKKGVLNLNFIDEKTGLMTIDIPKDIDMYRSSMVGYSFDKSGELIPFRSEAQIVQKNVMELSRPIGGKLPERALLLKEPSIPFGRELGLQVKAGKGLAVPSWKGFENLMKAKQEYVPSGRVVGKGMREYNPFTFEGKSDILREELGTLPLAKKTVQRVSIGRKIWGTTTVGEKMGTRTVLGVESILNPEGEAVGIKTAWVNEDVFKAGEKTNFGGEKFGEKPKPGIEEASVMKVNVFREKSSFSSLLPTKIKLKTFYDTMKASYFGGTKISRFLPGKEVNMVKDVLSRAGERFNFRVPEIKSEYLLKDETKPKNVKASEYYGLASETAEGTKIGIKRELPVEIGAPVLVHEIGHAVENLLGRTRGGIKFFNEYREVAGWKTVWEKYKGKYIPKNYRNVFNPTKPKNTYPSYVQRGWTDFKKGRGNVISEDFAESFRNMFKEGEELPNYARFKFFKGLEQKKAMLEKSKQVEVIRVKAAKPQQLLLTKEKVEPKSITPSIKQIQRDLLSEQIGGVMKEQATTTFEKEKPAIEQRLLPKPTRKGIVLVPSHAQPPTPFGRPYGREMLMTPSALMGRKLGGELKQPRAPQIPIQIPEEKLRMITSPEKMMRQVNAPKLISSPRQAQVPEMLKQTRTEVRQEETNLERQVSLTRQDLRYTTKPPGELRDVPPTGRVWRGWPRLETGEGGKAEEPLFGLSARRTKNPLPTPEELIGAPTPSEKNKKKKKPSIEDLFR